ncbi:hypothetical protein [Ktedonobacter racemifer]|uniref:KOW domain-containing protein n=1 Tax=Ktedonobacter racemifer DSM 44963 TaxID=485913 RepID=D6TKY1_KTERA|nr:hypothetical protein [Ktedonobacter racemifer]EFH86431.1 hypothetical protein Krac_7729 [Ktedonobacter racemifer DSM 44963]
MAEEQLQLGDRVQVIGQWPKGAKGKITRFVNDSSYAESLALVVFDRPHRLKGTVYPSSWYKPGKLQRI